MGLSRENLLPERTNQRCDGRQCEMYPRTSDLALRSLLW